MVPNTPNAKTSPASSASFANTLRIRPRPAYRLITLLAGGYLLAGGLVWWGPLSAPVQILLSLLILADGSAAWRRHVSRVHPLAVTALAFNGRQWSLQTADGQWLRADYRSGWCHPLLVILRLRSARGTSVLWVGAESVSADAHRHLRVLVRAGAPRTRRG